MQLSLRLCQPLLYRLVVASLIALKLLSMLNQGFAWSLIQAKRNRCLKSLEYGHSVRSAFAGLLKAAFKA